MLTNTGGVHIQTLSEPLKTPAKFPKADTYSHSLNQKKWTSGHLRISIVMTVAAKSTTSTTNPVGPLLYLLFRLLQFNPKVIQHRYHEPIAQYSNPN
jgi:hypothetical protein